MDMQFVFTDIQFVYIDIQFVYTDIQFVCMDVYIQFVLLIYTLLSLRKK